MLEHPESSQPDQIAFPLVELARFLDQRHDCVCVNLVPEVAAKPALKCAKRPVIDVRLGAHAENVFDQPDDALHVHRCQPNIGKWHVSKASHVIGSRLKAQWVAQSRIHFVQLFLRCLSLSDHEVRLHPVPSPISVAEVVPHVVRKKLPVPAQTELRQKPQPQPNVHGCPTRPVEAKVSDVKQINAAQAETQIPRVHIERRRCQQYVNMHSGQTNQAQPNGGCGRYHQRNRSEILDKSCKVGKACTKPRRRHFIFRLDQQRSEPFASAQPS
mmetsp:Transcript_3028/g.6921  ORF Transcript_3028/g.6921 Transcript_3028/m.6921 type:complete len:271 (-) Transcript_3028:776-1588(-)